MNDSRADPSWVDANQRVLVAEFARLRARLSGDSGSETALALKEARAALPGPAAIDWLASAFELSAFERDLLLLCAGVEMDDKLAALCASANGDSQRPAMTFGLALAALDEPHWSALTLIRPLRRWRLVELETGTRVTATPLRIDERVLHFLSGVGFLDPRLEPFVHRQEVPQVVPDAHGAIVAAAVSVLTERERLPSVIQFCGDDADGQEDVAALVATQLGLQLYTLRADDLPTDSAEIDALATLWDRESALLPGALLIRCDTALAAGAVERFTERATGLLFVSAPAPVRLRRMGQRFDVHKPDVLEQKRLWEHALGAATARMNGTLDLLASHFRLSARAILAAGTQVQGGAAASDATRATLWSLCQTHGRSRLEDLAQCIEPVAGWDDLVLPDPPKKMLRQIGAHVRRRVEVYERWGFARRSTRGLGISALFTGESGTGKTMAAEVLANELGLDLFRIDLSAVVNKYIGETEKNLKRIFAAAEDTGAILLFDEADALFGKRSDVKDSHDRYANIEVSYLLQGMEAYRGLAILTTNMKAALDTAFYRRLRFVVQFPFPDSRQRLEIWQRTFPRESSTEGIDYAKLARLTVAGGAIRNIALNAAFLAADEGTPVRMLHVLQAVRTEYAKLDRPLTDAETRGWA